MDECLNLIQTIVFGLKKMSPSHLFDPKKLHIVTHIYHDVKMFPKERNTSRPL